VPNMLTHSRPLFLRPWPPEIYRKLSYVSVLALYIQGRVRGTILGWLE